VASNEAAKRNTNQTPFNAFRSFAERANFCLPFRALRRYASNKVIMRLDCIKLAPTYAEEFAKMVESEQGLLQATKNEAHV